MTQEYVVVAKSEEAIDSLHAELTVDTSNDPKVNSQIVPDRPVAVADPRDANPTITHYMLTDEEAEKLAKDSRVQAVHPLPKPDILMPHIVQKSVTWDGRQASYGRSFFGGTAAEYQNRINWGLRRMSVPRPEPDSVTNNPINPATFSYSADGTGVDIVIMDDGIQWNHPEFLDSTGQSRVQRINWYTEANVAGTMPPGFYDCRPTGSNQGQHGTHVASIAAGKTYGVAKGSRIYSMRIFGANDQTISPDYAFDLIRLWHTRKPIDPKTKARRPTVVNMSWGTAWYYGNGGFGNIKKIKYRRNAVKSYPNGTDPIQEYGMRPDPYYIHGLRVPSYDAECQQCEAAGVVFVHSAGNFSNKVDTPSGIDYGNYYTMNENYAGLIPPNQAIYYHRGCSPTSNSCITVTAADNNLGYFNNALKELVATYSERGPGCDIVAPGSDIIAATSNGEVNGTIPYAWGTQTQSSQFRALRLSGTSMAAPQVTGVVALYLQKTPKATPAQAKSWVKSTGARTNQIQTSTKNDDWTNETALLGGANLYLYHPYR